MISYCAQGCILEWQTMLPKEVFIFFRRKNHFSFSECPKGGFFVKELPNNCYKIGHGQIKIKCKIMSAFYFLCFECPKWIFLWRSYQIFTRGASWNSKQCCLREFSFSLHGKFIFHFPGAWNEFFLWRTNHIFVAKLDLINFIKY